MNYKKPLFKSFKDSLGVDRHLLFDKDATELRWVGFRGYSNVCEVEFVDGDNNTWVCRFNSVGDQELRFDEKNIKSEFDNNPNLLIKAIEIIDKCGIDLLKWIDNGEDKNLAIAEVFEYYLNEANTESLYASYLPLVKFAIDNQFAIWSYNSWLEPIYEVKSNEGNILLDNYASNLILGEGIYYSTQEIKDSYSDPDYLLEIVKTYKSFFNS